MENNNLRNDLVYILYQGEIYMEWSEALKVLKVPRTSLLRTIEDLSLLTEDDYVMYKNRKLLREQWVLNFWRSVSAKRYGAR